MKVAPQEGGRLGRGVVKGEQLDAVAGGKDKALVDAGLVHEGAGGLGEAVQGNGKALAHGQRCGGVVHPNEREGSPVLQRGLEGRHHGALNRCTADIRLAAQTASTKKSAKLDR